MALAAGPVEGGSPKPVTAFTSGLMFGFAWSRDGRRTAITRGSVTTDAVLVSNLTPPSGPRSER